MDVHSDIADAPSPSTIRTKTRRRTDAFAEPRPAAPAPDRGAVEARAYELYQERGGAHGADLDDWLRAEQELSVLPM